MKKVIKKVVAKKPIMKYGKVKKSLTKAQDGKTVKVKAGPLTEEDTKKISNRSKNRNPNFGPAPYLNNETSFVNIKKEWLENIARKDPNFNTSNTMKKGGAIKSAVKKTIIKSKKK